MKTNKTYLKSLNKRGFFPFAEHRRKQYGFRGRIGGENEWKRCIYQSLKPFSHWDPNNSMRGPPSNLPHNFADFYDDGIHANPAGYGGIFNLEFSPEGRLLAAACQNKAIVLFDPLTHSKTASINEAHSDCVNGIKFMDSRLFASCSDDHTVAVWDVRNLSQRVHSLKGHTKWVKNIEYHSRDNLLVTSGFDGDVIAWDINKCSASGHTFRSDRLFRQHGLMRMKISPDLNKLLLCTSSGYMLLIQNLDLQHFQKDMAALKDLTGGNLPEERRVMGRTRNKPSIIRDFPVNNRAEIIHSMQIHPHSWAVLSRNTSHDDESEWTCVHDIQTYEDHDGPHLDRIPGKEELVGIHNIHKEREQKSLLRHSQVGRQLPEGLVVVGEGSNRRFELMLDNHGGNWVDARGGRPFRPDQDDEDEASVNVDEDDDEDDDDEDDDDDNTDGVVAQPPPPAFVVSEARRLGDGGPEHEAQVDGGEVYRDAESHHQRAVVLGLNILIQRNAASVIGDLRSSLGMGAAAAARATGNAAEDDGPLMRFRRRRGSRGRSGHLPAVGGPARDNMDRRRMINRYRWRVNRRLNQLAERINEEGQNVEAEAGPPTADADPRIHDLRQPGGRSWNERNDEIRRTLRSLRSGLDMVMENLNTVRRQIDNDVNSGLDFDLFNPDHIGYRRRMFENTSIKVSKEFYTNFRESCPRIRTIYAQQRPRLTHYMLEPNVGHGFIKELCFSSDGRLICSPYKQGIRLLAFDADCAEMSHCVPTKWNGKERPLREVSNIQNCHNKSVVSTKFSPTHTLLVSGCLDGKITWHQPVL